MRERERDWVRRNPDRRRAKAHRRRSREANAEGFWTADEWAALVEVHWNACAYCGRFRPLTVDHRIPLARGGSNWIWNLLPACSSCNRKKGARTEWEFRRDLQSETTQEPLGSETYESGVLAGSVLTATMRLRGAAQPL